MVCELSLTHSHLPLTGTEIQVKASLKPLVYESWIPRHLPQAGVPGVCVCVGGWVLGGEGMIVGR